MVPRPTRTSYLRLVLDALLLLLVICRADQHVRRGKSDLILEGVLRVERFLQEISASIVSGRPSIVKPEPPRPMCLLKRNIRYLPRQLHHCWTVGPPSSHRLPEALSTESHQPTIPMRHIRSLPHHFCLLARQPVRPTRILPIILGMAIRTASKMPFLIPCTPLLRNPFCNGLTLTSSPRFGETMSPSSSWSSPDLRCR